MKDYIIDGVLVILVVAIYVAVFLFLGVLVGAI